MANAVHEHLEGPQFGNQCASSLVEHEWFTMWDTHPSIKKSCHLKSYYPTLPPNYVQPMALFQIYLCSSKSICIASFLLCKGNVRISKSCRRTPLSRCLSCSARSMGRSWMDCQAVLLLPWRSTGKIPWVLLTLWGEGQSRLSKNGS